MKSDGGHSLPQNHPRTFIGDTMDNFAKLALEASGVDYSEFVASQESSATPEPEEREEKETGIEDEILSKLNPTSEEANSDEETEETEGQEDASAESEDEATESKEDAQVDYVYATGPKGRKKIKVDYSDKERIKRAYQKEVAADLYKVQRDSIKKENESLKETAQFFNKLDEAFVKSGPLGVIRSMKGGSEALEALIEEKIAEREAVAAMSPEEKRIWEKEQEAAHGNKEVERLRAQLEARDKADQERAEQAKVAEIEKLVTPAFERYRFQGKLNNEEHEYILDKMLWTQVEDELNDLPEEIPLTQAMVDSTYRNTAAKIRKMMSLQADTKVKKIVDNKKAKALASAQVAAKSKIVKKSQSDKLAEALQTGDFKSVVDLYFK